MIVPTGGLTPNGLRLRIEDLLKNDERLVTESGEINYTKVHKMVDDFDSKFLELLLSNDVAKENFFKPILKSFVFEQKKFLEFLDYSSSNNSYSKYLGKEIGLYFGDELFIDRGEVVLNFPYKDCILEGGQSTEDGLSVVYSYDETAKEFKEGVLEGKKRNNPKRREVFYNEILARDEIDQLLSPKALCNAFRYSKDKKDKITSFSKDKNGFINDNLVIKGNNLLVLSGIQKQFSNRIKCIYWDVPYNTGSDSFKYNDNFSRSTWLTFIKNRVENAMPLLTDDGVLLIQCSFHQYAYLKVMLDNLLKTNVMTFNVLVRHPDRTLTADKPFNDVVEYILVYSKNPNFKMPKIVELKTVDDYIYTVKELKKGKDIDFDGRKGKVFLPGEYEIIKTTASSDNFKIITVRGSIKEKVSSGRFYMKYLNPLEKKYPSKTLFKVDNIGDDKYDYRYFYLPPEGNKNGAYLQGMPTSSNETYYPYPNFLDFVQSYNIVNDEGNVEFRNGKKPEDLIAFLLDIFTKEGDWVLDSFAGSGTTASVAMKMNRKFITSEQMDYIEDITTKRIQGVIQGEEDDLLTDYPVPSDASFVYFELAKFNEKAIEEISACYTYDELKNLFASLSEKYFLHYNVHISKFINETIQDQRFIALDLKKQKEMFVRMLDLNQLYVNKNDCEDTKYELSEDDIKVTKAFYGDK